MFTNNPAISRVGLLKESLDKAVVIYLGYSYPRLYEKTSYINQNETQEPLELRISSDPRTQEIRPRIEELLC
jgi:hypothetical protein